MLPARILDEAPVLPLDEHPAAVYLSRLSRRSRRTQLGALEQIARILSGGRLGWQALPWHELRYQHTQALRRQLADRYATATANRMLAAVRGTLKEAWRLGLVDQESYARAVDLGPIRGEPPPHGRALASDELRRLLAACRSDPTPTGRRDAALLGLLYATGLRRFEAVALDMGDWDGESVIVRHGKGNRSRRCYLADDARALLRAWVDILVENIGEGDATGGGAHPDPQPPLFVRIRRGGSTTADRLSDQSVRLILQRRCREAGVEEIAPHSLRRTFVTSLLAGNVDLATVAKMAGHRNVQTTARYDRRSDERMREVAQRLALDDGDR